LGKLAAYSKIGRMKYGSKQELIHTSSVMTVVCVWISSREERNALEDNKTSEVQIGRGIERWDNFIFLKFIRLPGLRISLTNIPSYVRV